MYLLKCKEQMSREPFTLAAEIFPPDHDHKGHQKSPMQTPSMQSAMLEEAAIGDSLCNHERRGGKRTDSSKTWVNGIAEIQGETGTSPEVCFHLLVFFLSRVTRERNPSILLKMLSNVPNSRLTLKMWHEEQTAEDFWGSIYNVPTVHIQEGTRENCGESVQRLGTEPRTLHLDFLPCLFLSPHIPWQQASQCWLGISSQVPFKKKSKFP